MPRKSISDQPPSETTGQKKNGKAQSAFWVILQLMLGQSMRLAANLVLARLVAPDVFSIMALSLTLYSALVMLTDVGIFGSVLLRPLTDQDADNPKEIAFLHTAWTLQIIRGLGIWAICLIGALLLATLHTPDAVQTAFDDPRLPLVLALTSTTVALEGFRSVNMHTVFKRYEAKRYVIMEIASQLASITTTLSLAYIGFGIWGVVAGNITMSVLMLIGTHTLLTGPKMALAFEKDAFFEIFGYGKWVFLSSFVSFLNRQSDRLVFGFLMLAGEFGIYTIAMSWIMTLLIVLRTLARKVFQPAFVEAFETKDVTTQAQLYKRLRLGMDVICSLAFLGLFFIADPLFDLLYDSRYDRVGSYMPLLGLAVLLEGYRLPQFALLAAGRSKDSFHLNSLHLAAMATGMTIALVYGSLPFAMLAFLLSPLANIWTTWRRIRLLFPINLWAESRMLLVLVLGLLAVFLWRWPFAS